MLNDQILRAIRNYREKTDMDESAKVIYDATRKVAMAVIGKYCSDKEEREDILQDTYIIVFQQLGNLEDEEKIQAWINKIAMREAIHYMRKRHSERYQEMTEEDGNLTDIEDERPEYQPGSFIDREAERAALQEAMENLSQAQRDLLNVVYGQHTKIKEAAETFGISENTAKSRLLQGRRKIEAQKDIFRKYGVEVTAIPIALLIAAAFEHDVYAAEGVVAGTAVISAAAQTQAAARTGVKAGAGGAKGAVGTGFGVKAVVGVAAAALIGGGVWAASSRSTAAVATPPADDYITLYEEIVGDEYHTMNFYEYQFSDDGKKLSHTFPNTYVQGLGFVGCRIIDYDEHENIEKMTSMDTDGGWTVINYENEYVDDLLIQSSVQEGDSTYIVRYEYNDDGKIIYQYDGKTDQETFYERDTDGSRVIATRLGENGDRDNRCETTSVYQYNEDHTLASRTVTEVHYENGEQGEEEIFQYEYLYDETGMWRKLINTNHGNHNYRDSVSIQVSQQYLFEHPDAEVPAGFAFDTSKSVSAMSAEETRQAIDDYFKKKKNNGES